MFMAIKNNKTYFNFIFAFIAIFVFIFAIALLIFALIVSFSIIEENNINSSIHLDDNGCMSDLGYSWNSSLQLCIKNNSGQVQARQYTSLNVRECEKMAIDCTSGYTPFNDEFGCGCEIISSDIRFCSDEERNADSCIEIYSPVCAFKQVECIRAPCPLLAENYPNSCFACQQERTVYYFEGECY